MPSAIFAASTPLAIFASVTTPLSIVQVAPLALTVISPLSPSLIPPPTVKSPLPNNDVPLIDLIFVWLTKVSCFAFKAVCVAVDTGLSASAVLSTLPKPTSPFTSVTAPVLDARFVPVLKPLLEIR